MKTGKRSIALFLSLCVVLCGFGVNFSVFAADPVVNVQFNAMDSQMNCDMEPAQDNTVKDMTAHKADFLEGTGAVKFRFQKERSNLQFFVRATGSNAAGSGSPYDVGVDITGATHMIFDLYVSDVSQWTIAGTQDTGLRGLESKKTAGDWFDEECGAIRASELTKAFSNVRNGWNHIVLPIDRTNATSNTMWGFRLYFKTGNAKADFHIMMDDVRFVNQAYLNSANYTNDKAQKQVNRASNILTYLKNNGFNSASPSVEHRRLMVEANVTYHGLTAAQQSQVANKDTLYTKASTAIPPEHLATRENVKKGDYAFSLAVLSDLHYAVRNMAAWQNVYRKSMQWIIDNQDKENILMTLQLGDLTSNVDYSAGKNEIPEWDAVRSGYDMLRQAGIPFATVIGNHDRVYSNTNYNVYFPYEEQKTKNPYFGGAMKEGVTDNLYYTFEVSGVKYMILTLGLYPHEDVLSWADSVVKAHPDHNVIVTTHSYLLSQDTYNVIHTVEHEDPAYTGQQVWNQLIKCNPNIIMTLNAHNEYPKGKAGLGLLEGVNDAGKTVYQFLVGDPQVYDLKYGGTGSVTMLRFSEDGKQVSLEYICTREDKRLVVDATNAKHTTKNYITVDVEPVMSSEATTSVTLGEWSAEDLLNAAKATGSKNAAGQSIYEPQLRDWRVGVQDINPNKVDWVFTNNEQTLTAIQGGTHFNEMKATDKLKVEIVAKAESRASFDQGAGFLSIIMHNNTKYMMDYLFTEAAAEAAEDMPEIGEGVKKYTWVIDDLSKLCQLKNGDTAGSGENNRLQLRSQVLPGASLEFYSVTVFNETQKTVLLKTITRKMEPNGQLIDASNAQPITRPALVTYTGIDHDNNPNAHLASYTTGTNGRPDYNGGLDSQEAALIGEMPLGALYEGTTTLNLSFASGYGLGGHRKFTLLVKDTQGNEVLREEVNRNVYHEQIGYNISSTHWLTDSGDIQNWAFPITLTAQQAGKEYTLSILTYNETDLALFGLSLTREAAWQSGLNPKDCDEDGQVVIKNWDYMSLAKLDGDYTSSDPDGKLPQIQYTTDFDSNNPGKVPVGIEYYSEIAGGAIINPHANDTSGAQSVGVVADLAEITVGDVNLSAYENQKLQVEIKGYLTAPTGEENPWVRLYHGGNSDEVDGVSPKRVLDFGLNSGDAVSGNDLGSAYTNAPLATDPTYGYTYKLIKGQRTAGEGAGGFHNHYASIWILANRYHYTTTNTYRVYEYTLKDKDGKVILSLSGEDWVKIAEQQNAKTLDGEDRKIKARVLWGYRADSYKVSGLKSAGGNNNGTWIKEMIYDHEIYGHDSAHTGCGYEKSAQLFSAGTAVTGGSIQYDERIRLQFGMCAPKGFDGKTLTFQLKYRKNDGTTGNAMDSLPVTSDANGNLSLGSHNASGSGLDGTSSFPIPGVTAQGYYVTYIDNLYSEVLTASANGTLKEFYLEVKFNGSHNFTTHPLYNAYVRFNVIRTIGGHTCWLFQTVKQKDQVTPTDPTLNYAVAMEPYYDRAENAPSTTPLATISASGAVETKLLYKGTVQDTTYSEELSFTQPGHYEVVWEVSGPEGSDFELTVDRYIQQGTKYERKYNLNYTMDGGRKICVLPFEVIDPTDRYTFRMDADQADISLWEGKIRTQKMALADGVLYTALGTAMEEVSAGGVVEMLQSDSLLENASMAIPADATLDLRGNTLTAKHLVSFGQVRDSGKVNVPGGLKLVDESGKKITSAEKAALILQEDNKTMPLFDADLGGYRFFDYTFENAGTKAMENGNKAVFGYFLKFDHADAYALLAKDQAGFAMDVNVRWTGSHTYHHHIAASTIQGFAKAVKTKLDQGAKLSEIRTAITLTIGGVNLLGQNDILCTAPTVRSENTRVESSAGEEVYDKIA